MAITKIAQVTVGTGGAATIDITSIPATSNDLLLVFSARSTAALASSGGFINIKFNNSSSTYVRRLLYSDGASVASHTDSLFTAVINPSDSTSNTFGNTRLYVPNYSGSAAKSVSIDSVTENNANTALAQLHASSWSGTAAINQITLTPGAGTFVQYSSATLYLISNAGATGASVS